jgi:hypothetical protein
MGSERRAGGSCPERDLVIEFDIVYAIIALVVKRSKYKFFHVVYHFATFGFAVIYSPVFVDVDSFSLFDQLLLSVPASLQASLIFLARQEREFWLV